MNVTYLRFTIRNGTQYQNPRDKQNNKDDDDDDNNNNNNNNSIHDYRLADPTAR
jgi:hypothetical protein